MALPLNIPTHVWNDAAVPTGYPIQAWIPDPVAPYWTTMIWHGTAWWTAIGLSIHKFKPTMWR
jgi:hypothetical protein